MSSTGLRLTPLEMLAKLVSFDTVSSRSNLPLIEFVESYLQSWNVPYVRVPDETGDKAAIYATIGPRDRGAWRIGEAFAALATAGAAIAATVGS